MAQRKTHGVKKAVEHKAPKVKSVLGTRCVDFEPNDIKCALCGKLCGSFSWVWRDDTRLCREDAIHYLGIDTK